MPRRVRLLTFDRLPDTGGAAPHAPETTRDRLTARSAFFENHYLQLPGVSGILAPFSDCLSSEFLHLMNSGHLRASALMAADFASSITGQELPAWLNATYVQSPVVDSSCLPSGIRLDTLQQADLCWLHFDLAMDETQESLFRRTADFAESLMTESDDVTIITALNGTPADERVAFASLLWEGRIRVPLWLMRPGASDVRVPLVTGSFDIACTIEGHLLPGTLTGDPVAENQPANLISLAQWPGHRRKRSVHIRQNGTDAIRTEDFLYVRKSTGNSSENSGTTDVTSALYAKPEDIWNVNDVSAEYFEVVDTFRRKWQ